MKQILDKIKPILWKYERAINNAVNRALLLGLVYFELYIFNKLGALEIGEYPEEPAEIILARLREMRPVIVKEAAVRFQMITIVLFIIILLVEFKRIYDINLIGKLWNKIFRKGSDE